MLWFLDDREFVMKSLNSDGIQSAGVEIGQSFVNELRHQKLLESRKIFLAEGVTADVARRIVSDLLILDSESSETIYLFVNSPGGEVNSGFSIFDTIRMINSPVKIVNCGLCASIATIINVAAKKENRLSLPNTRFLVHQPLIMGQVYGQASDLEITAKQILMTREKINRILAEECGRPLEKVAEDTVRDYWMNAPEAKEYGLISRIVDKIDQIKG
jgi:ATP-dependent Clp protease protease subunit